MKTFKKLSAILLSAMLAACLCVVAACGVTPDEPEKTYYTVTATYNAEQGKIVLSPTATDNKYEANTSVTATVTAEEGYEIATFTVDGAATTLSATGTYTFTVTKNTTLAATFNEVEEEKTYYTVTTTYDAEQGKIELSPTATDNKYEENTSVTATVTAEEGYEIATFTVDGIAKELSATGTYTFTVTKNTELAATFNEVEEEPTPIPAELPETWRGTYYRATGDTVIVIDATGLKIDDTLCPVTKVGDVYHTEWNGGDYILSLNDESYSYGVLRLTYTVDNGATEITFYESDLSGTIATDKQGTWVDKTHNVTLVLGEKTVSWNGEELTVIIIGTSSDGKADIYVLYDDAVLNIFVTWDGNFHCYIGNEPYDFVKDESGSKDTIPDTFHGTFKGELEDGTEVTLVVTGSTVTLNGEEGVNPTPNDFMGTPILTFTTTTFGKCTFYAYTDGDLSLETNSSYCSLTKQA